MVCIANHNDGQVIFPASPPPPPQNPLPSVSLLVLHTLTAANIYLI